MSIKHIFIFLIIIISLVNVLSTKARKISSLPDLSETSKKFLAFTIDFRGIKTPAHTYWCLLQWGLDKTKFKETHPDAEVLGGAAGYGGLQSTDTEPHGIMSFWQLDYKENGVTKNLKASRVYPSGEESIFTNEGEGTNYIDTYKWSANIWYRFIIYSWKDNLTGNTFVGQWIQNLSTKEWTLFAYFDTKLKDSYIIGPLFQFQENYLASTYGVERSSQFKNMYVLDKTIKKWVPLSKTKLYCNFGAFGGDTAGTSEFGFTSNYFYMNSGLKVDDQDAYDKSKPDSVIATLNQPDTPPDFIDPKIKSLDVTLSTKKMIINWSMDSKTSPCFKFGIGIYKYDNSEYSLIKQVYITRPEERTYSFTSVFKGKYRIQFTCSAISNSSDFLFIDKTI